MPQDSAEQTAETTDIQDVNALRAENERLKDELQRLRKALLASQASSSSQMSSRLRDALRE